MRWIVVAIIAAFSLSVAVALSDVQFYTSILGVAPYVGSIQLCWMLNAHRFVFVAGTQI